MRTDFLFTIPNPVKNVTALKISNAELQNTYYTVSNYLKSNIFYVHLVSLLSGGVASGMYKIEIPEGNYTSEQAVFSINGDNGFGFKRAKLSTDLTQVVDLSNIIESSYDSMTKKIIFGLKSGVNDYTFDLDFVLHGEPERDIAENLGWLLGNLLTFRLIIRSFSARVFGARKNRLLGGFPPRFPPRFHPRFPPRCNPT